MKYVVILCDGMADLPIESLGGKTPMSAANKPNMDRLAKTATVGMVKTVADGMSPGSDVANLSVMGFDPAEYYTGRSPLEAASIGIDLTDSDVAIRCNLVTLSDEENYDEKTMVDYCGGDISTEEADVLIKAVNAELGGGEFDFYTGVQYRHCTVWHGGKCDGYTLCPPHDISGRVIGQHLAGHKFNPELMELMKKSYEILKNHPLNLARIEKGERPANSIWLWGQGTRAALPRFEEKYGIKGAVISAVDLLKGIAKSAKMESIDVDGATGYIDTNFEGKTAAEPKAAREIIDPSRDDNVMVQPGRAVPTGRPVGRHPGQDRPGYAFLFDLIAQAGEVAGQVRLGCLVVRRQVVVVVLEHQVQIAGVVVRVEDPGELPDALLLIGRDLPGRGIAGDLLGPSLRRLGGIASRQIAPPSLDDISGYDLVLHKLPHLLCPSS